MPELAHEQHNAMWDPNMALQMAQIERRDGAPLSARELLFSSQFAYKLTGTVPTDDSYVEIIWKLRYPKTFELKYTILFGDVRTKTISTDFMKSNFLLRARPPSNCRIVPVSKSFRMRLKSIASLGQDSGTALRMMNVDDSGLLAAVKRFVLQLLDAAAHYVTNLKRSKNTFPIKVFYVTA